VAGETELREDDLAAIVAGSAETCWIQGADSEDDPGSVRCVGVFEAVYPTSFAPPAGTFVEVALDAHGCARSEAGELSCWGADEAGQADVPR
jgi:uncharacterized membrane protein